MRVKWQENNFMVQYPVNFWNTLPWPEIQGDVCTLLKDPLEKCIWVCVSGWVGECEDVCVCVCVCLKWLGGFCGKFLDALLFQHHCYLFLFVEQKKNSYFCLFVLIIDNIFNPFLALLEFLLASTSKHKPSRMEGTQFTLSHFFSVRTADKGWNILWVEWRILESLESFQISSRQLLAFSAATSPAADNKAWWPLPNYLKYPFSFQWSNCPLCKKQLSHCIAI